MARPALENPTGPRSDVAYVQPAADESRVQIPAHGSLGSHPQDSSIALISRGLDVIERLASPVEEVAKRPGGRGQLAAAAIVGGVFGVFAAIGAIAWHDASTRNSVSPRLDKQDETINGLVDVTADLLDEGEDDMACIMASFKALRANREIPECSTRGRDKIRRNMPEKIESP